MDVLRFKGNGPGGRRVVVPAAFLFLVLTGCAGAADENLLRFLVERNAAARAKIDSYSYTLTNEWKTGSGNVFSGTAQVKTRGDCYWMVYDRTANNYTTGRREEVQRRMVINDRYMAMWHAGNPIAYWYDHASVDSMSRRAKSLVNTSRTTDFLGHCFGTDRQSFAELMLPRPDRPARMPIDQTQWVAVKTRSPRGRLLYEIRRYRPTPRGWPRLMKVWTLDPEKGFLVTEVASYHRDGSLWYHRQMDVQQVEKGLWFPVSYRETCCRQGSNPAQMGAAQRWKKIDIKDVQLNIPLPDSQFNIGAMQLQKDMPEVTVLRIQLDSEKVPYVYDDGELMPADIAAQKNREKTRHGN